VLRACREPLLVLHRYLAAMACPHLADAVVAQAQEPLARLEHAIRATQVRLLPQEALAALEALVRVYTQVLRLGGRCGATRSWLMAQLGCSAAPGGGGGASAGRGSEGGSGPSDTLQLLLDVMRTRPYAGTSGSGATGGGSSSGGGGLLLAGSPGRPRRSAVGGFASTPGRGGSGSGGGGAAAAAAGPISIGGFTLSRLGVDSSSGGQQSGPRGGAGPSGLPQRDEARLRLWLWRFMTELLRFALSNPNVKPLGALFG
jgi:hypothetical protein